MSEKNKVLEFLASKNGKIVITIISIVIIYGILFAALESNSSFVLGVTLLVCAFFGWTALNRITPQIFLFMSIGGWAIYLLIKGLLAIVVGAFVAPFQIGKIISDYTYQYLNTK